MHISDRFSPSDSSRFFSCRIPFLCAYDFEQKYFRVPPTTMSDINNKLLHKAQSKGQNRTSERRSEFSITKAKLTSISSWFIKSSMFLGCNGSQQMFSARRIFFNLLRSLGDLNISAAPAWNLSSVRPSKTFYILGLSVRGWWSFD